MSSTWSRSIPLPSGKKGSRKKIKHKNILKQRGGQDPAHMIWHPAPGRPQVQGTNLYRISPFQTVETRGLQTRGPRHRNRKPLLSSGSWPTQKLEEPRASSAKRSRLLSLPMVRHPDTCVPARFRGQSPGPRLRRHQPCRCIYQPTSLRSLCPASSR